MSAIPPVSPHRNRHGCLWGCLLLVAILLAPVIGTLGYGAWYLHEGFRRDPLLRTALETLRHDGLAEQVLGAHLEITGIEGNAFSAATGLGRTHAYIVGLHGTKGTGMLALTVVFRAGRPVTTGMTLTGPDGRTYDLLTHAVTSPPPPTDSI